MIYGSVCSGIEGASVAWDPLGWRPAWFAEIDPFASAVLAHRWPGVPNLGDFTRIGKEVPCAAIDLLVGGTPCQAFSVAGKRLGLDDPRGHLTLEYLALAGRLRPRWLVWENVPGVLSDDGGRTFGTVLGLMGQLGYGFAYRVLDAQHFGIPQRRRRVFVVGHLGAWQPAAAVLFEPESLRGDPPPSRTPGQDVARTLTHGSGGSRTDKQPHVAHTLNAKGGAGRIDGESETFITAPPLRTRPYCDNASHEDGLIAHTLRADGFDASEDGTGRGTPLVADTLRSHTRPGRNSVGAIAFHGAQDPDVSGDVTHPLGTNDGLEACIATWDERNITSRANRTRVEPGLPANTLHELPLGIIGAGVRRLTPMEAERLQGFSDDYTLVPYNGKPAADGPRYRALGNSFPVPVVRWIGERIAVVDEALSAREDVSA